MSQRASGLEHDRQIPENASMISHHHTSIKKGGMTFISKKSSNENKESVGGIQSGRSPVAISSGSPALR